MNKLIKYKANLQSNLVIRKTKQGREFLVAPVVAAFESVMNGQLILGDELLKSAFTLNGRPLTIYHPNNEDGAGHDDIPVYGYVYDAHVENNKLKANVWLDIELIEKIGKLGLDIIRRVRENQILEVSLGWFQTTVNKSGTYKGKPYTTIATDILHDHLAILPDVEGSCSVADGCGLVRNEADDPNPTNDFKKKLYNFLGIEEVSTSIANNVQSMEVDDMKELDDFKVEISGKLDSFQAAIDAIKDLPDLIENQQNQLDNLATKQEVAEKAPFIQQLVANESCTVAEDTLEKFTVEELKSLVTTVVTNQTQVEKPDPDYTAQVGSTWELDVNGSDIKVMEVE